MKWQEYQEAVGVLYGQASELDKRKETFPNATLSFRIAQYLTTNSTLLPHALQPNKPNSPL